MMNELFVRVAALEAQVKEKKEPVVQITPFGASMLQQLENVPEKEIKKVRPMCPKCGEQPNYFYHVKNCTGQKKNKNDADDRRRDISKA